MKHSVPKRPRLMMKDVRLRRYKRLNISTTWSLIGISFQKAWRGATGYDKVVSVDFMFFRIWYYYSPIKTAPSVLGGTIYFY